jgi:hypothetical protein
MLVALTDQGERLADQALRTVLAVDSAAARPALRPALERGRPRSGAGRGIEPNRTFPKPGEDYEGARKRAAME